MTQPESEHPPRDFDKQSLAEAFINRPDEFWDIEPGDESHGATFYKSGFSAVCCTGFAVEILNRLGSSRVRVFGKAFSQTDNPELATYADGHDFALVDNRWVVDPWVSDLLGLEDPVLDLMDPADYRLFVSRYGDTSSFKEARTNLTHFAENVSYTISYKDEAEARLEPLRIHERDCSNTGEALELSYRLRILAFARAKGKEFGIGWAQYTRIGGFSTPDPDVAHEVTLMLGGRRILDPMAGLGLWPAMLKAYGAKVTASDIQPPGVSPLFSAPAFMEVEAAAADDAVVEKRPDVLVIAWPYPECAYTGGLLDHRCVDMVLYVGTEPANRRCGPKDFWKRLDKGWIQLKEWRLKDSWDCAPEVAILFARR